MDSAESIEADEDEDRDSIEEGSESEQDNGDSEDSSEEDENGDMFPDSQEEKAKDTSNFQHFSGSDKVTEVQKGNAVRNQLNVWDGILEFRIQLQKCMISANQLPCVDKIGVFKSEGGKDFASAQTYCTKKVTNLLDKLMQLQSTFLKQNPETKSILSDSKQSKPSKDPGDEEITSSEDENEREEDEEEKKVEQPPLKKRKLQDFSSELTKSRAKFLNYQNTTIQKWNDKTRVAQGKISSKNFSAFEQSTLKQIEQVLADKQRLLKRTRMKRSAYRILGEIEKSEELDQSKEGDANSNQQFCPEIFDDDDFYHQLLRELIEHKSEGVTDPVQLGRQWIALQKLRSKMKRKIDTRATKGRKIRYTVHPKLVNFMAPYDKCSWSEESKAELFNSLFAA